MELVLAIARLVFISVNGPMSFLIAPVNETFIEMKVVEMTTNTPNVSLEERNTDDRFRSSDCI